VGPFPAVALETAAIAPLALGGVLYARRAATLAARGRPVAGWRMACAAGGAAVVLAAVAPPFDARADRSLPWHMGQHLLLGDLAALLLALGLTGPLLRPLLARRSLRRLRVLAHPALALPLWVLVFAGWHVPVAYDAAADHAALHAVQHATFVAAGLLAWMPLVETLPAPRSFGVAPKLAYSLGQRGAMAAVGYVLLFASAPLYAHYAGHAGALDDQRAAAGLMMLESGVVGLVAIVVLLRAALLNAASAQALAEAGASPREVARVYRRGPPTCHDFRADRTPQ
jgi:cytochrome c oxidase assembly factor CtaG